MLILEAHRQDIGHTPESEIVALTRNAAPQTVVASGTTSELVQILDQYLADLQAGAQPDRDRLLADHPEFAEQLEECLAGIDFLHGQGSGVTPDRLGDFQVIREVGRGGMGVVYEAEQISLKRRVALKVLRFGGTGPEAMQRFRREAETVAELHHTNIVPIFAIGCEDDVHYYAMQFIEGRSLAELADAGTESGDRFGPADLAGWAQQAAEALAHAHRRGVVHRDVKPSNLILDAGGRIWLTDFGLAKRAHDVTLSVAGALLGTPRYMSPEQAEAMTRPVDHRTDIYSLGATLYELATGRPIFQAESAHAVIAQILNAEPPTIRSLAPGFPRDLETIILKCLAKDPEKRYQSAGELADDLRAFLDERPIQARRTSLVDRARRWSRRNPLAASLSAALATALVAGLVATTALWTVAEERRAEAEQSAVTAGEEREAAEDRLWESLYEQARAERLAGHRWRSLEVLDEARRLRNSPSLRQEAIQAVTASGIRIVASLGPQDIVHGGDTPRFAFSPDGALVATPTRSVPTESGAEVAGVKVWNIATGRLVSQAPCIDHPVSFAFSPTKPVMALSGEDDLIRIWDPTSQETLTAFPGRFPVLFSPDGALVAVRGVEGITIHDVPHGHVVWQLPSGMPVRFLADRMLLVREGQSIDLWSVENREKISSSPPDRSAIWTVELADVAGEQEYVALRRRSVDSGLREGPVTVWHVNAGRTIAELSDVGRVPYSGALPISAAAELFAFPDPQQSYAIRLFDLRLGTFRRPLLSPGTADQPMLFGRFNRDGTILAAQEGGLNSGVRLWDTATGESIGYLHDHENPVWSPDGRYLAVLGAGQFQLPDGGTRGGNRAALVVYEVASQVPTTTVRSRPAALAFREDGRELAAQGSRFDVGHNSHSRLRPLPSQTPDDAKFVATGDGLWRFHSFPSVEPPAPVRIERVFPESAELLLEGVTREEAGSVQGLAVSPDGRLLLVEWQRQVPIEDRPNAHQMVHQLELWDLASGSRVSVWAERPERMASWGVLLFSPDGQLAVTTESGYAFLRAIPTGEILQTARMEMIIEQRPGWTHSRIYSIADAVFTPDGRLLVCGGEDGQIGVCDVDTGQMQALWRGHDGNVNSIAVSPDGLMIASGGDDKLLRLWELSTGQELARWEPHQNSTTAIQFSPDGRQLATACSDGTIRLWDLPAIREQLATLELDWQSPAAPGTNP